MTSDGSRPDFSSKMSQFKVLLKLFLSLNQEIDFQSLCGGKGKRYRASELLVSTLPALWKKGVCIVEANMQREAEKKEELVLSGSDIQLQ